jgi:hypothetical protein
MNVKSVKVNSMCSNSPVSMELVKVIPNFNNLVIKKKFMQLVIDNLNIFVGWAFEDLNNKQLIIDNMYEQLTTSILSAYDACTSLVTKNSLKSGKNWFTKELKTLKEKMICLRSENTQLSLSQVKILKKKFKQIMKRNINLYEIKLKG